ncbi:MAG: MFS transporter [Bacteroidales bacterium]|jgi:ACS family hexuronate transporter-like MFS transporter|nr:MFS transporter [Bacteroidales bacterium]
MKIKNYRWIIVILLFFATTINYIDRQIIGLLKPILEAEFNWTESDFAYIVMAFTAAYAIGLLVMGRVIDKIGTRIGYSVIIALWSIAGMFHALARSVVHFCIARIGLGIGEAGNFPAGMKAISEWFPKRERGIATGIFNSGPSVGVVMALLIVPWILSRFSWHEVFWITGASGFLWLIFWLILYQIPARQKKITKEELELIKDAGADDASGKKDTSVKIKWIKLFSFPQMWALITGKGLIDPIFWFFLFWLPSYFSSTYALDLTRPSIELIIIYSATTLGSFLGGYFSSFLVKRGWDVINARKRTLLIFAIAELSIIFAQYTSASWMTVAIISLAVAVHQAWATNVFTMASDMFPSEAVGSAVGIAGMAGAVGGILFPMLVGFLLDTFKAAGNITAGYNMLFTICGLTYLAAWFIIHVLTKNKSALRIEDLQ